MDLEPELEPYSGAGAASPLFSSWRWICKQTKEGENKKAHVFDFTFSIFYANFKFKIKKFDKFFVLEPNVYFM